MRFSEACAELGLSADASHAEAKKAWRKRVSQWHPDRNPSPDAHARMQRINWAWERFCEGGPGEAGDSEPDTGPATGSGSVHEPAAAHPQAAQATAPSTPPQVLRRKVKIGLEDTALGCIRPLRGQWRAMCTACAGEGHLTWPGACSACAGSGQVKRRTWFGWSSETTACEDCAGSGAAQPACTTCDGSGKLSPESYDLSVRLPAGMRDGDVLSVPLPHTRGAAAAELQLRIELQPHALFKVGDDDGLLHAHVPVDIFSWLTERDIRIPTPDGPAPLTLRRESRTHRLPGQGIPAERRGPRGDLVIHIQPQFPKRLSAEQTALLQRLIATCAEGPGDGPVRAWERAFEGWAQGKSQAAPNAD
ncbi:MAG: hypothetical protein RJA98_1470 [Pseudomonadota bacterium]|jgi:molecular chaperone DnaJ